MSCRGKSAGRKRRQPSPTTRAGMKRGRQDNDENEGESLTLFDRPERPSGKVVDFEQLIGDSFSLEDP
ncbi:hypothetical protein DPMN_102104 [Dreissena polymorpha]|uniref:Uncharacterized protein n=1 Tax=Dreissena polymorpha TaxID=45954 RepID=A0A9D4LK82_DREPO|nr:hypothetical protein DPMN_102104 [Dreissena polymorpha]